jgi:hypothetical protein
VFVPALYVLFRYVVEERIGAIILSGLVAHTSWHWLEARWADLGEVGVPMPDALVLLWTVRLLMAAVIVAGAAWLVQSWRRARRPGMPVPAEDAAPRA